MAGAAMAAHLSLRGGRFPIKITVIFMYIMCKFTFDYILVASIQISAVIRRMCKISRIGSLNLHHN